MTNQTIQHYNPHPGEHLVDEFGMSRADLARSLGIPRNRVSEIIRGRRGISADTALRLARWLDTLPQIWLNLQAIYDLRKAEDEHGAEIRDGATPLARSQTREYVRRVYCEDPEYGFRGVSRTTRLVTGDIG